MACGLLTESVTSIPDDRSDEDIYEGDHREEVAEADVEVARDGKITVEQYEREHGDLRDMLFEVMGDLVAECGGTVPKRGDETEDAVSE